MTTGGVSLAAPWSWESRPAAATVREAREEISADAELVRLVDGPGGPDNEASCPNGDRTAYVTAVYEARIIKGSPAPGDSELSELAWFTPGELPGLPRRPRTAAHRRLDQLRRTREMQIRTFIPRAPLHKIRSAARVGP